MKRLFGTDGIRGVAGEPPLDRVTVTRFGASLADALSQETGGPPRVVLGRDTRESGPWLRDAVVSGLRSRGAVVVDAGVTTTPGLAFATRVDEFHAGVMISASHNPFGDNGLKVFSADGTKLGDETESAIESAILDSGWQDPGERLGPVDDDPTLLERYVRHLGDAVPGMERFRGLRMILDCANGSASAIAPGVFRSLGAEIETIGTGPDGRNINEKCGSLHLGGLSAVVRDRGFDMGIAFDGDADRALAVDRRGKIVDGDHILFLMARKLKRENRLPGNRVVATIMSNFWLEKRLSDEGIELLRAPVGDKYVVEMMAAHGASIGGEQSGHVIVAERATTGDGILTGLLLTDALLDEKESLEEFLDSIVPYPQVLLNVKVREKPDLTSHPVLGPKVTEVKRAMSGDGRIVLRYSGTEPLARVMVEGSDPEAVRRHAESLAAAIRAELGS